MPGERTPASWNTCRTPTPCCGRTGRACGTTCTCWSFPARLRRWGWRLPGSCAAGAAGPRWPFVARTTAHAYSAYQVDALQYLLLPVRQRELSALLARATEPEYGPSVTVNTAEGLRALPYAGIEYLECTHHIVHFHLTSGGGRAHPVAAGAVFCGGTASAGGWALLQPHRSYVVNLAEADLLSAGELRMRSGARISIPRGREGAVRDAFQQWVQQQKYSLK